MGCRSSRSIQEPATWADVAPWHFDVMAYGDGIRCQKGRFEYPSFPHGQQMPNANARYDAYRPPPR